MTLWSVSISNLFPNKQKQRFLHAQTTLSNFSSFVRYFNSAELRKREAYTDPCVLGRMKMIQTGDFCEEIQRLLVCSFLSSVPDEFLIITDILMFSELAHKSMKNWYTFLEMVQRTHERAYLFQGPGSGQIRYSVYLWKFWGIVFGMYVKTQPHILIYCKLAFWKLHRKTFVVQKESDFWFRCPLSQNF